MPTADGLTATAASKRPEALSLTEMLIDYQLDR